MYIHVLGEYGLVGRLHMLSFFCESLVAGILVITIFDLTSNNIDFLVMVFVLSLRSHLGLLWVHELVHSC